jgi:hypothetical protein
MLGLGVGLAVVVEAEKDEVHAHGRRWRQPGVSQHMADDDQLATGSQRNADMAQSDARPIRRQHLFIEEMTKTVLESGLLHERDGKYVTDTDAPPTLAVPATLQASLVAGLDRIEHARTVGQTGAALGRDFTYPVLKAVLKRDDDELVRLLEQLVASALVHQRGIVPDAHCTFKHALVQDAIYETLLRGQRIHQQEHIVGVLETDFPAITERNPDVLACHCTEAGLWENAIAYWLRSAHMALDRSAPRCRILGTQDGPLHGTAIVGTGSKCRGTHSIGCRGQKI